MFDLLPHRRRSGSELVRFRDEIDNLFNRFFDMDVPLARRLFGEGEWAPRLDISERTGEIIVKAEIPGCDAKDIDVTLEGRLLTIRGEKKKESEDSAENYHRLERAYGSFSRMVELPADVDPEAIDATYKKGILKLVLRKIGASEAKKIAIKNG